MLVKPDQPDVDINDHNFQRFIKGITPDIKSNRCKLASKTSDAHMMNESSARLIKNQGSFLTPNPSFVNQD